MKGDGRQDGSGEDKSASTIQKGGAPARQVFVHGRDQRETVSNANLIRSEGEAKIDLWESRNRSTKRGGEFLGGVNRDIDWQESSFMIVDRKSSSVFKDPKDMLSLEDSFAGTFEEDQGVVGILENGARCTVNKRVGKVGGKRGMVKEATKDVSHNDKKLRGKRVTLPQAIMTVNPFPRQAIEKDSSLPRIDSFM